MRRQLSTKYNHLLRDKTQELLGQEKDESSITDEEFLVKFKENNYDIYAQYSGINLIDLIRDRKENSIIEKILQLPGFSANSKATLLENAIDVTNIPCIELILNDHTTEQIDDDNLEDLILYAAASSKKKSFSNLIAHYKEKYPELAHYRLTLKILQHSQQTWIFMNWNACLKNNLPEDQLLKEDMSKIAYLFTIFSSDRSFFRSLAHLNEALISLDKNEIASPALLLTYAQEAKQQNNIPACLALIGYIHSEKIDIDPDEIFSLNDNLWDEISKLAETYFIPPKKEIYKLLHDSKSFSSLKESYLKLKEDSLNRPRQSTLNSTFEMTIFNCLPIKRNLQIILPDMIKIAGHPFHPKEINALCLYHETLKYLYNTPANLKQEEQEEAFSSRINKNPNETQLICL